MLRLRLLPLVAVAALAPATADAATTIGQVAPAGSAPKSNFSGVTQLQYSTPASASYAVPAGGGVITSWSMQAGPGPFDAAADHAGLRVFRPAGGDAYTLIGASAAEVMRAPFSSIPVRIAVRPGDVLGVHGDGVKGRGTAQDFAQPGAVTGQVSGDPQVGQTLTPQSYATNWQLNVSAVVEPDADGDGFGDETQDACATNATTQGACPAPPVPPVPPAPPVVPAPPADTLAPKLTLPRLAARQKAARGYVALRLVSPEAATVKITGRRVATLTRSIAAGRPTAVKVKLRKGVRRGAVALTITARDAAGNVSRAKRTITLTR